MTSREHARRLMLILLTSPGGPEGSAGQMGAEAGEAGDERQATDGRDDSEGDLRRTAARIQALALV
jgi:hypothetical protein